MLMQAYDNEKGAGTMSPTLPRAIGPEPWNAKVCRTSRRPADGRCGETQTVPTNTTNPKWS